MAQHLPQKPSRWERIRKHYHLIIRNQDTFEELYNIKLNALNVYILISTVVVCVAVAVFLLIAYTPLKNYIPGYGTAESNTEYVSLLNRVNRLEEHIANQNTYIESFRKLLTKDVQYAEEYKIDTFLDLSGADVLERIPEDDVLRQNVDLDNELILDNAVLGGERGVRNPTSTMALITPVDGFISLEFNPEMKHYGIDIVAPQKSPIKAIYEGNVISSGWDLETGHTLGVQHSNNLVSFYKHNAKLLVKEGDFVTAGQAIAVIGNSGKHTDGPHLHFEMWMNGKPLDPSVYFDWIEMPMPALSENE